MNNSSDPVTIEETQKILEQMTNCICKIKLNEIYGNGFFCKLHFPDNTSIRVLTTSYNFIDENYLKENNEINLILNNNDIKIISVGKNRKIYLKKEYDLTLIELKDNDKIENYFEFDENLLSQENLKSLYENKSIYVIQYLNMEKPSVSYGILTELTDLEIKHTCNTKSGSCCSPILNSNNNKIIGITKGQEKNDITFNQGILLKLPVLDFKNQIDTNIKTQLVKKQSIKTELNANNGNKIANINNVILPSDNTENELIQMKPEMMIVFKTGKGLSYGVNVTFGTTVEHLLQKFIKEIKKKKYVNVRKTKIKFLFNSVKLNENEKALKTTIEKYFNNRRLPTIIVTHL